MKKIIAKIDCTINNTRYLATNEIKNLTYNQIAQLNEKGFIEPLSYKDLVEIERELNEKNNKGKDVL